MEDAASETSDWEVLSAPGGDDDVVLVSGEGGDVLHDHFALVLSDAGFSGEGSWSRAASEDEGKEAGLQSEDRLDWISEERLDLAVEDSSVQSQVGVVDETAESSVLDDSVAGGATWSAEEKHVEATHSEMLEQEKNAARGCGKLDSILQPLLHHGVVESLDADPTVVADGSQSEVLENSEAQLGDGVNATRGNSVLEAVVACDGMKSAQEDLEQGENASATSDRGKSDGEVKDGSLPLAQAPSTGEGERQVVVWWRLPFRLLQYCAWKVKPVWSISIAAALLGLVVLGRRMYRMRHKTQGLPQIKIAFDDKWASGNLYLIQVDLLVNVFHTGVKCTESFPDFLMISTMLDNADYDHDYYQKHSMAVFLVYEMY